MRFGEENGDGSKNKSYPVVIFLLKKLRFVTILKVWLADHTNKKEQKMKYQVYQITKLEAQTEIRFSDDMASAAAAAMDAGHYTHVADIEADDLDAVFEIGNIGPEENIERHGRMSSISVCDVIATDETSYVVAPIGFKEIARGEG